MHGPLVVFLVATESKIDIENVKFLNTEAKNVPETITKCTMNIVNNITVSSRNVLV